MAISKKRHERQKDNEPGYKVPPIDVNEYPQYVFARTLLEPMGVKPRLILADYHDGRRYLNHSFTIMDPGSTDADIVQEVRRLLKGMNPEYVVYSVIEVYPEASRARLLWADRKKEKLV